MSCSRALFVSFLLLTWLPGCYRNDNSRAAKVGAAGEPAKKSDQTGAVSTPSAPKDLADLLKARGYVEIPLTLTKDPYFVVEVKINGQPLHFLLDTGAQHTDIDKEVAGRRSSLPAIRPTKRSSALPAPAP